jgi:pyrroloquinoline quinone (PQQ) biosynthesis protein C
MTTTSAPSATPSAGAPLAATPLADTPTADTPTADSLAAALTAADGAALDALADATPAGERDRYATLLAIYAVHTAPLAHVGDAARFQHHPVVAALKGRCEQAWIDELAAIALPDDVDGTDPIAAMRALAARDRLPLVYKWLARSASWPEVVTFLALEGGPDAGFDDLVASCQVGLFGAAKMELATNYWDEMGNGDPDAVHTTLHDQLVDAIDLPRIPLHAQPLPALARAAFGGLLATNRWLQPEMLGALGLIELQAGPRCRMVLQAFDRCGAPAAAYPFYEVHAEVDPRHGKDWLDKAIAPTVADRSEWGERIVRGALWRSAVNAAFLDDVTRTLVTQEPDQQVAAA